MATVLDVAKYILEKQGSMSAMKLQKLVYYSQAWAMVWNEQELFPEEFEAWANGPVCRELYDAHRGRFRVDASMFDSDSRGLTQAEKDAIHAVLKFYGKKTAQWLSDLSHMEQPWKDTWGDRQIDDKGCDVITKASMHEYYSGLNG